MNTQEEMTLAEIVLVVLLIITLAGYFGACSYSCHKRAEKQGLECEWGVFQGCMVKMPSGNWMDYDRLRYMEK